MKSLFELPRSILVGIKEAGAADFLLQLLKDAHPALTVFVVAHRAAAKILTKLSNVIQVPDEFDIDIAALIAVRRADFVLVGASIGWSIEKAMTIAARKAGIPVYSFIDNYMNVWQRFAHQITAEKWYYAPDTIYSASHQTTGRLCAEGFPPQKVLTTTHPSLQKNSFQSRSADLASNFRTEHNLTDSAITLTIVMESGYIYSDLWNWDNIEVDIEPVRTRLLSTILSFCESANKKGLEAVVLIKAHPSDGMGDITSITKKYSPDTYRFLFDTNNETLISVSTAIFGIGSMLLYEAGAKSRRAYCMKINADQFYPFLDNSNQVNIIRTFDQLLQLLETLALRR